MSRRPWCAIRRPELYSKAAPQPGPAPASAPADPRAPATSDDRPPIRECVPELSLAECVVGNLGIKASAEDIDACLALAAPLADVDPDKANDFKQ